MRRRTRSPKGSRGAGAAGTRGGRGRGRARGGAKAKTGRGGGGGKATGSNGNESSGFGATDCINAIAKDNHHTSNSVTSSHFSRTPNGAVSYTRGEHKLQLGGIPRRPFMGPAQHNGNTTASNSNNNNGNNNGGVGSDFYRHKKFKKVTATVDVTPSSSSTSGTVSSGSVATSKSSEASGSSSASSASGMVYKPKFRIKSDIEAAQSSEPKQLEPEPTKAVIPLVSPREKTSPLPATPAPEVSVSKVVASVFTTDNVTFGENHHSIAEFVSSSSAGTSSRNPVSLLRSSSSSSALGSESSAGQGLMTCSEPGRIGKELRLDRKSLDERISKLIDENQSILEWPEQFTKMLKNHTSRGQNSHQRTSHLLSGGSTTEISSSNMLSHHQTSTHNGLLRHSSSSSDMSTSGGSVELFTTSAPHLHHTLLNTNGVASSRGRSVTDMLAFKSGATELHQFPLTMAGGSTSSTNVPTDLSFGAHNNTTGGSVVSTTTVVIRPSPSSSASSTSSSTTSSSMVPKKRRRLSPTPSRLCGGEVSELPSTNDAQGNKTYFQDVDMTVRVSNCGTSGAKVTIRTNNGTISGGSVQTASNIVKPVDFTKMIEPVPSPLSLTKPPNGAIFFPGPGPSSSGDILHSPKPLSLVSSTKISSDSSTLSSGGSTITITEIQKHPKSPRGRPPRKKSVPDTIPVDCATVAPGVSLLRVNPPPEIPGPKSGESTITQKTFSPSIPVVSISSSNLASMLPSPASASRMTPIKNYQEAITPSPPTPTTSKSLNPNATAVTTDQDEASKSSSVSPTPKSENSQTQKDNSFQVVPTPTQNPKRPTFLALKPVNTNSKKTEPGVLPSPETPRVAKPYNQMTINGQAYTYLGFKVSTRSSYTCLFKTQPMFISQETDPKLSMYTNWQPRPRDPNQLDIGISTNDSRVNGRRSPHSFLYTSAAGKSCDTLTVSSPDNQAPISSPICENKTFLSGLPSKMSSDGGCEDSKFMLSSPLPTSSSQSQLTQPIKIQVSPSPSSSGIVPISPPSNSSSPVSFSTSNGNIGLGGLMSIAALSSNSKFIGAASMAEREKPRSTPSAMSSSDTNSADETSSMYPRRRRSTMRSQDEDAESNLSEGPLALLSGRSASGKEDGDGGRAERQRVKIMEGGFESNEDYTYVRGRGESITPAFNKNFLGRGRYVCEACGIRCKKPSMLRKHLKTHTDLRPYTCKLCNFSFKTKGNLTKHQKSKSHHKKCAGLGIHPESSTSLAMTGPAFSISDTNTTDDNESDDDFDDNGDIETDSQDECEGESMDGNEGMGGNGNESFEKEIAQSLLDLSKATVRLPSGGSASASSDCESGNDARMKSKRSGFPFSSVIEEMSNSSVGSFTTGDSVAAVETPIDLSVKPVTKSTPKQFTSTTIENESKRIKLDTNGLVRAAGLVKEAEVWDPSDDEASRCLNLKKVLNTPEINSELPVPRVPEVKTEPLEFPVSSMVNEQRPMFGPRQRTESETSSCSATSNSMSGLSILPSGEGQVSLTKLPSRTPPLPQPSSSGGSCPSTAVKLHQPWLSPSEPKEKKETVETVPSIEIRPVIVSPDVSKFKSKPSEDTEPTQRESPVAASTSSNAGPPISALEAGIAGISSPNSKLFSGLSAIKPQAEFRQPSGPQALVKDEGKAECNVCGKTFARASQLTLHMNIHYIERPFRCDPCGVSFRTKGHLIKHRRSSSHDCKVYLTEAWGVANEENPRPFKCPDCKIAFRIHGHLAKHLRSKMHIMRMECLGKLPFGIYFEMEKSGINLNEIDTTDCDMSLVSLQNVARKIYGDQWRERLSAPVEEPPA